MNQAISILAKLVNRPIDRQTNRKDRQKWNIEKRVDCLKCVT